MSTLRLAIMMSGIPAIGKGTVASRAIEMLGTTISTSDEGIQEIRTKMFSHEHSESSDVTLTVKSISRDECKYRGFDYEAFLGFLCELHVNIIILDSNNVGHNDRPVALRVMHAHGYPVHYMAVSELMGSISDKSVDLLRVCIARAIHRIESGKLNGTTLVNPHIVPSALSGFFAGYTTPIPSEEGIVEVHPLHYLHHHGRVLTSTEVEEVTTALSLLPPTGPCIIKHPFSFATRVSSSECIELPRSVDDIATDLAKVIASASGIDLSSR